MTTNTLIVQRVPLDSLVPDPANARLHEENNIDAMSCDAS